MGKDFLRGSEWRKWDLHLHTPASKDDYKNSSSITAHDIVDALKAKGISVVAITDHNIIDEDWITQLQAAASDDLTILPGIELRTSGGGANNIHIIGIFSEDANVGNVAVAGKQRLQDLITTLGITRQIAENKSPKEIYVDMQTAIKEIHNLGGLVSIHAGNKHSSIETISNKTLHEQMAKTDVAMIVDFYEVSSTKDIDGYEKGVFPEIGVIPTIIGSDNHNVSEYMQDKSVFTWIKADPTFEGLKQAVCDPRDRIFVGEEPELLIRARNNGEKYIKGIKINPHNGIKSIWFDQAIPLNPGLVSIIGKKGSGKSALADILALSTEIHHKTDDLTFAKKFQNNLNGYDSTLLWNFDQSGIPTKISLSKAFEIMKGGKNKNKIVHAKYIPQNYLENLCNPDKPDNIDDLQAAIDTVIYAYLSDDDKAKYETLKSLIDDKTSDIKTRIGFKQIELAKKIDEVCAHEERFSADYRAQLENKREGLCKKIQEHREKIKLYPKIALPKASEELNKKLQTINGEIAEVDKRISEANKNKSILAGKINTIGTIREKLATLTSQVKISTDDIEQVCATARFEVSDGKLLSVTDIVTFSIDQIPLNSQEMKIKREISAIDLSLTAKDEDLTKTGLLDKKAKLATTAKEIKDGMDSQTKAHQDRVDARKKIAQDICDLHGAYDKPDTLLRILYLLNNIPNDDAMLAKYDEIITLASEIYGIKTELKNKLEEIYTPVQEIIKNDGLLQTGALNITTDIYMKEILFKDGFFEYIKQNIRSSFKDGGAEVLSDMISKCDFTKDSGIREFLKILIDKFRYISPAATPDGEKSAPREHVNLTDLFKMNKTLKDFYSFLFGLEYIEPKYSLKFDGRDLLELSPGERGALLLIFYLLLDASDAPLIIDQPEENLDNESIYKLLVPTIKEALNKKQIIMVTHNPNLAVVCDSDQIICADKEMVRTPVIQYSFGAIENLTIRGKIIDILEGTKPAFQKREEKYDLT